jgi:hypothetical protein
MKISYVFAAPVLLCLCVMPLSASDRDHHEERKSAQHARYQDRDHDRDHNQHWQADRNRYQESREGRVRREREEWRRHHESARHDFHDRDAFHQPAGVDHGQKRGWQGRDLPPGQAKKTGYDKDHDR